MTASKLVSSKLVSQYDKVRPCRQDRKRIHQESKVWRLARICAAQKFASLLLRAKPVGIQRIVLSPGVVSR
jgi:hypothetical protein